MKLQKPMGQKRLFVGLAHILIMNQEITLDPNEVVDFKWLSKEEIADYIASEKMVYSVGLRYNMFGSQIEGK